MEIVPQYMEMSTKYRAIIENLLDKFSMADYANYQDDGQILR